jgi:hypothetical protein
MRWWNLLIGVGTRTDREQHPDPVRARIQAELEDAARGIDSPRYIAIRAEIMKHMQGLHR